MNTLKTIIGFFVTLTEKYTPLKFSGNRIDDIYNYQQVNSGLGTSGQPTREQFSAIARAGYDTVINLLPDDVENAMADEDRLVASLGMRYIHIPVKWTDPREADYLQFAHAMRDAGDEKVWVHCAANCRVSAFVYRYRVNELNEDADAAMADVQKIWQPFGVWKKVMAPGAV